MVLDTDSELCKLVLNKLPKYNDKTKQVTPHESSISHQPTSTRESPIEHLYSFRPNHLIAENKVSHPPATTCSTEILRIHLMTEQTC